MGSGQSTAKTASANNSRITNREDFLLVTRADIVKRLRRIAKGNCMVTAIINGGIQSMNTAILDVIPDINLVALDSCLNESANRKMLKAERVIFKTTLDGIDVQFTADSVKKANYEGQSVFAISIPDKVLWLQRRDLYRIRVPVGTPAYVNLRNETGGVEKYCVLDISAGGVAILDDNNRLNPNPGTLLNCQLYLPGHGDARVILEVLNCSPISRRKPKAGQRLGCSFVDLDMSFGANIQRYILSLDILRKRAHD